MYTLAYAWPWLGPPQTIVQYVVVSGFVDNIIFYRATLW